jgi:preprotein translocase subunit SecD
MLQTFKQFWVQFRITGLDSPQEASELALMLRAGALLRQCTLLKNVLLVQAWSRKHR